MSHRIGLSAAAVVAGSDVTPNVFLVGWGGGGGVGHVVGKSPSGILQSCGGSVSSQAETANVLNEDTGQMTQRAKNNKNKKGRQV